MTIELNLKIESPTRSDLAVLRTLRALRSKPSQATISRRQLREAFRAKKVTVTHPRQKNLKAGEWLPPGEYPLAIQLAGIGSTHQPTHWKDIKVLADTKDYLVVYKPSGLPTHPNSPQERFTLVHWVLEHFPEIQSSKSPDSPNSMESGLLHRLDTQTSGCVCFAKTTESFERLKEEWPKTRKTYRAVTLNSLIPQTIHLPLYKRRKTDKKMTTTAHRGSRPIAAETTIHTVTLFKSGTTSLYDLTASINKGARHQIRCHLAALGAPILGDTQYGGQPHDRFWLHAWKVQIAGTEIESPLPNDWPASTSL